MDFFTQFSDVSDKSESSTLSDSGTGTIRTTAYSDEEVILASDRPKRRAGRRIFKETRHPIYRGVRKRNNNKWVCELREPNKKSRIWLGTYPTAEMAARAHDVASLALRGKSACLNFADSAWRFQIPASSDRNVIRKAAAQAANECNDERKDDVEERVEPSERIYVEEVDEDLSDMPMLLADLAEGLLLSPPPFYVSDDVDWGDVSLWSF